MDADSTVGGADGDLVRAGCGDGDRGEFKCKCSGWFESFVVDGYRTICYNNCGAVGTKFGDVFWLAAGGGWGTTVGLLVLYVPKNRVANICNLQPTASRGLHKSSGVNIDLSSLVVPGYTDNSAS